MADFPPKIILPIHSDNNPIVESGTTIHFIQATSACTNRKLTKSPHSVTLLYYRQNKLTHTAMLSLQNLLESARRVHILPKIKLITLLSVIQLCYQWCRVKFTGDQFSFTLENQRIITGPRDKIMGLWTVLLATP